MNDGVLIEDERDGQVYWLVPTLNKGTNDCDGCCNWINGEGTRNFEWCRDAIPCSEAHAIWIKPEDYDACLVARVTKKLTA